jgi:hypothetical protein
LVDEEIAGHHHEVTGERLAICDLCGRPVPRAALVRHAGVPGVAEPVEVLHICPECQARLEIDDVPFDQEIAAGLQEADD